ncbi:MAG: hypothetical protein KGL39_34315 [Patescibacteria group bacterium]|nr:hypothetical protein [Patescibacteria group bacterium]
MSAPELDAAIALRFSNGEAICDLMTRYEMSPREAFDAIRRGHKAALDEVERLRDRFLVKAP